MESARQHGLAINVAPVTAFRSAETFRLDWFRSKMVPIHVCLARMNPSADENMIQRNIAPFRFVFPVLLAASTLALGVHARADELWKLSGTVGPAAQDASEILASVPLAGDKLPPANAEIEVRLGDATVPGQMVGPSLTERDVDGTTAKRLCFVIPAIKTGETLTWSAAVVKNSDAPKFSWHDVVIEPSGEQTWRETAREARLGDKPLLRYMYPPLDTSSPKAQNATMKVYHHVFDPARDVLLTKGAGGLFPHHKGLYYGFNKISYNGGMATADTWHCNNGESQKHVEFVSEEAGPVLARHVVKILWNGKDGKPFAEELREMTAIRRGDRTIIDFASKLSSLVGEVKLDGDPQHAGYQFRATQQVPDVTAAKTYYVRPDGVAKPGKFRNWPDNKEHVNLPWHAMVIFVPGGEGNEESASPYTVMRLEAPTNPKETRHSERDYGRFGAYFEATIDKDKPLYLRHRVVISPREEDVAACEAAAAGYAKQLPATAK